MSPAMIIILVTIAFIALSVPLIIWDAKKTKRSMPTKEQIWEQEEQRLNAEGEVFTTHAEVIDTVCGVKTVGYQGYKQPKALKQFMISFKVQNGEVLNVFVAEELYEGFDIGMMGTLTLIDGQLDSFKLDEP